MVSFVLVFPWTTRAATLVVLPGGGKIKTVLVCTVRSIFGRGARAPISTNYVRTNGKASQALCLGAYKYS